MNCPLVVLAHSLGSVVTYEPRDTTTDVDLDVLVTFGSPLALPHVVFNRLDPPRSAISVPGH